MDNVSCKLHLDLTNSEEHVTDQTSFYLSLPPSTLDPFSSISPEILPGFGGFGWGTVRKSGEIWDTILGNYGSQNND